MSIKVITEPTIYLVGSQYERWHGGGGIGEFLTDIEAEDWTSDANHAAEILPEIAGRLCYLSFKNPRPGGNKAYLDHILEVGHGSVLEHAVFNFIITGVSRSLTHELVRHRVGMSYSQLSQRYVDESDVAFVVPPAMLEDIKSAQSFMEKYGISDATEGDSRCSISTGQENSTNRAIMSGIRWLASRESDLDEYTKTVKHLSGQMIDFGSGPGSSIPTVVRKAAREAARSVLPNSTETRIFVTANARALRHFFELRANAAADAEIRRLAVAWLRIVQKDAPNLFGDFIIEPCPLGGEMASTPYPKV